MIKNNLSFVCTGFELEFSLLIRCFRADYIMEALFGDHMNGEKDELVIVFIKLGNIC